MPMPVSWTSNAPAADVQALRAAARVEERRDGERIEVTHRSSSRATYAQGVMRAAKFVAAKPPGFYSMDDVLGI